MIRLALAVLVTVLSLNGPVWGQQAVMTTPAVAESRPAWCGGSWWPGTVVMDGDKVVSTEVGGTSFGECKAMSNDVAGTDGKAATMSVPTHPAYPTSRVTMEQGTDGIWFGSMSVVEKDKDNKEATVQRKIEPIRRPVTK